MPHLQTLSHSAAAMAIDAMARACADMGKAAVFAAVDRQGELLAFLRMDGASQVSTIVAQNKGYTAARLGCTTKDLAAGARDPVNGFDLASLGDPRLTFFPGGFPILIDGDCIGAIGVSGLANEDDATLAAIGLDAVSAADAI